MIYSVTDSDRIDLVNKLIIIQDLEKDSEVYEDNCIMIDAIFSARQDLKNRWGTFYKSIVGDRKTPTIAASY